MVNIRKAESRIRKNLRARDPQLDLSNLSLTEMPSSLFELKHLRTLSLTGNKLVEIDRRITTLSEIRILGLNYNLLSKLPTWIGELSNLTSLDCWNNRITEIPLELGQLKQLQYLTLGFNNIETIPRELFKYLSGLKALDLQNNPLSQMSVIRDMSIIDLMIYFRNESSFFGFIEVPKEFSIAFQQYFDFFPEYVRQLTGYEINFSVERVGGGVKLSVSEVENIGVTGINHHFSKYIGFLLTYYGKWGASPKSTSTGSDMRKAFLELQMKQQVQHFHGQIENLQFQNKYLESRLSEYREQIAGLMQIQEIMSKNPRPVYVFADSQFHSEKERILKEIHGMIRGEDQDAMRLYGLLAEQVRKTTPQRDRINSLAAQFLEKAPGIAALVEALRNLFP